MRRIAANFAKLPELIAQAVKVRPGKAFSAYQSAFATYCFTIPRIEANVVEKEVEFQATRAAHAFGQSKTDLSQAQLLVIFIWASLR